MGSQCCSSTWYETGVTLGKVHGSFSALCTVEDSSRNRSFVISVSLTYLPENGRNAKNLEMRELEAVFGVCLPKFTRIQSLKYRTQMMRELQAFRCITVVLSAQPRYNSKIQFSLLHLFNRKPAHKNKTPCGTNGY